jgi:hypothetical protein
MLLPRPKSTACPYAGSGEAARNVSPSGTRERQLADRNVTANLAQIDRSWIENRNGFAMAMTFGGLRKLAQPRQYRLATSGSRLTLPSRLVVHRT